MRRPDEWGKLQMFPTSFSFHTICLTINAEAGEVVGECITMYEAGLDLKKVRAIARIEQILKDCTIEEFKIGKTDDCERRKKEHQNEGYISFKELATCDTLSEVNQLETFLINLFINNSKCGNVISGGSGCTSESDKYFVYVITK